MALWQMWWPKRSLPGDVMNEVAFMVRPAGMADLPELLALYTHLHEDSVPDIAAAQLVFAQILQDDKQCIMLGEVAGKVVSSCTVIIIPNLTNGLRPYCVIENVVTHKEYRAKGYATALLREAKKVAVAHNCYKMMLMTGSKSESVLSFYERAGFNKEDKTAFVQWL